MISGWVAAFAKSPAIPLCQAFDGRYNNSKGVSIYKVKQKGNYYCSMEVKNNPAIAEQLQKWAKETEKLAESVSTEISNGTHSIVLYIPDGDVNVGIHYKTDNSQMTIFLRSDHPFLPDY